MNWTIKTLRPCPAARMAVPSAAVVLPLPGPVWTIIRPFRVSLTHIPPWLVGAPLVGAPGPGGRKARPYDLPAFTADKDTLEEW